jgi:hypothetical protein
MKYILLLIFLISIFFCNCFERKPYCTEIMYKTQQDIRDSAKFIENVVKNATFNLHTSDYEDVDDTIQQAERTAYWLFQHRMKICYDANGNKTSEEIIEIK